MKKENKVEESVYLISRFICSYSNKNGLGRVLYLTPEAQFIEANTDKLNLIKQLTIEPELNQKPLLCRIHSTNWGMRVRTKAYLFFSTNSIAL